MRERTYAMPAYMIVNVEVNNATAYEEYKAKVPALIRKHGGEYLVRGGNFVVLEGDWKDNGKDSQNKHTDLHPRAVFTNLKFSECLQTGSRSLLFQ
jgi:Domain of unknown function (DUF1330)